MTATSGKRERRDASAWAAVMARHAQCGLSVTAFCARERLSTASFYQWRTRLGRTRAMTLPVVSTAAQRTPSVRADAAAPFIDLGALGDGAGVSLRIDFGGGLVLQLMRG